MTASTMPQLQPLNLGELLDRAIRIYRRNFLKFSGVVALVQTPVVLLQIVANLLTLTSPLAQYTPGSLPPPDPSDLLSPSFFAGQGLIIVVSLLSMFSTTAIYAVIMRGAADTYLHNQETGLLALVAKASRSFGRLFLAVLLVIAVAFGLLVWMLVPCIGWITGPGLLIFGSWVMYPLIIACCVLESRGAAASFRRAWDLARRRFWWTMGFAFLITVFGVVITIGPSSVVGAIMGILLNLDVFAKDRNLTLIIRTIVETATTWGAAVLTYPIMAVAFTLMYFDLRVRTEGFDLAVAAAEPAQAGSAPDLAAQAPLPETGRAVTGKEIGFFALLSVIVTVPIIALYGILLALVFAAMATLSPF